MVEHAAVNRVVEGSSPSSGANVGFIFGVNSRLVPSLHTAAHSSPFLTFFAEERTPRRLHDAVDGGTASDTGFASPVVHG